LICSHEYRRQFHKTSKLAISATSTGNRAGDLIARQLNTPGSRSAQGADMMTVFAMDLGAAGWDSFPPRTPNHGPITG